MNTLHNIGHWISDVASAMMHNPALVSIGVVVIVMLLILLIAMDS